MKKLWENTLRHIHKRSIRYKILIFIVGLVFIGAGYFLDEESVFSSFGVAILASIFAAFLLQVFPPDELDSTIRSSGIENIYYPASIRNSQSWFELLTDASQSVDLMGRTIYRWIVTNKRREKFSDLILAGLEKGVKFRILVMSKDSVFLAALEEKNTALHETLAYKVGQVEDFLVDLRKRIPEDSKENFEIRLNHALPFYQSLARFDSVIFVTPYLDNIESGDCALWEIEGQKKFLYSLYSQAFDALWNDKRHRILRSTEKAAEAPARSHAFKEHFIRQQQESHLTIMRRLWEKSEYDFHDFEDCWEHFFHQMEHLDPANRTLRDLTLVDVALSGFKGYDLRTYPPRVVLRARDIGFDIKIAIVVNGDDAVAKAAELYLLDFIKLLSPESDPDDFHTLFSNINQRFDFIVVPKSALPESLTRPFNVYGDIALSRSMVTGQNRSPHLCVSWNPEDIATHLTEFDSLWDTYAFTKGLFCTTAAEAKKLDGSIIASLSEEPRWKPTE